MLEANQIKVRLADALEGKESLCAFANWLSRESASLRYEDEDTLNLVDSILSPLQVYFDRLISESQLRNELRMFIPREVQSINMRFILDDLPVESAEPHLESVVNSQSSQARFALASFAT